MQRKETYKILKHYYKNNSYLNLLLKQKNIPAEKMGSITMRVYGIIQNKEYIDYLISKLIDRDKIDLNTRIIMEIAVYEYIFMKKPQAICASEGVNLAKIYANSAKGYINAKLRNLDSIDNIEINFMKEEKNLEIKYSHPRFIVKMLMKQYPNDYEDILKSNTQKKDLNVRKIHPFINEQDFTKIDIPTINSKIYKYNQKSIVNSEDFINGNIIIQDIGSYLVGEIVDAQSDEVILDLCAAPGNKTMHIAQCAKLVVANEINNSRYNLLNENLEKFNINNVQTINCDATNFEELKEVLKSKNLPLKYDKVLVDAPCSGLGVIKSKPEIKYNMSMEEIKNIINIQKGILKTADLLLKDNGHLIYSTCTLNKDENEKQVKESIDSNKYSEIENLKIKEFIKNDSDIGMTLKPHILNSDGFYIIKLERNDQ